jgi:hypothetical protein
MLIYRQTKPLIPSHMTGFTWLITSISIITIVIFTVAVLWAILYVRTFLARKIILAMVAKHGKREQDIYNKIHHRKVCLSPREFHWCIRKLLEHNKIMVSFSPGLSTSAEPLQRWYSLYKKEVVPDPLKLALYN